jgi:hypothetical protein
MEPSYRKPDFLCIGMQKAGTQTLYDLLRLDNRFAMPSAKEIRHFSNGQSCSVHEGLEQLAFLKKPIKKIKNFQQRRLRALRKFEKRKNIKGELSRLDRKFERLLYFYELKGFQDKDYLKMFDIYPQNKASGDITPAYSGLTLYKIEQVQNLLPKLKIVLIIRDPISRAISSIKYESSSSDYAK